MVSEFRVARIAVSSAGGLWVFLAGVVVMPAYRGPMLSRPLSLFDRSDLVALVATGLLAAAFVYAVTRSQRAMRLIAVGLVVVVVAALIVVNFPPLGPTTRPDLINPSA